MITLYRPSAVDERGHLRGALLSWSESAGLSESWRPLDAEAVADIETAVAYFLWVRTSYHDEYEPQIS